MLTKRALQIQTFKVYRSEIHFLVLYWITTRPYIHTYFRDQQQISFTPLLSVDW
jgi:hypothetical protein